MWKKPEVLSAVQRAEIEEAIASLDRGRAEKHMPSPAEIVEKALRKYMRLRTGDMMSGAEAEDAARIAVDALTGAGMVVVSAEETRAVRRCPNGCGRVSSHPHGGPCETCWDGLGLPERTDHA